MMYNKNFWRFNQLANLVFGVYNALMAVQSNQALGWEVAKPFAGAFLFHGLAYWACLQMIEKIDRHEALVKEIKEKLNKSEEK